MIIIVKHYFTLDQNLFEIKPLSMSDKKNAILLLFLNSAPVAY